VKKLQNLAIIQARGGSTRIPQKNIIPFLGKPLISYVIEACRSSALFDRILVATDDDGIAATARECGLEVPFKREFFNSDCMHTDSFGNPVDEPNEIDRYYMEKFKDLRNPIAEYCLERLKETTGEEFSAYCIFPGNAPFITGEVIVDLYQEFSENNRDFAMTVARCGRHPWFFSHGSHDAPSPIAPDIRMRNGRGLVPRTQDLPELFLLCNPMFFKVHCPKDAANAGYVQQEYQVCLDIDTYDDLIWYEKLGRGLLSSAA
jgi:CMP-N-acetylneuraminic acid synthetase